MTGTVLQLTEKFTDYDPISKASGKALDKPLHALFTYGCAHYVIDGFNKIGMEEKSALKYGTAIALTTYLGWRGKEIWWDNNPDPTDMMANYSGLGLAIAEDFYDKEISASTYETPGEMIKNIDQYFREEDKKENISEQD
ncbi:MAG: hypothetical protein ABEJ56_00325 [Candidatus Nanohaloarchaea archaeon]